MNSVDIASSLAGGALLGFPRRSFSWLMAVSPVLAASPAVCSTVRMVKRRGDWLS